MVHVELGDVDLDVWVFGSSISHIERKNLCSCTMAYAVDCSILRECSSIALRDFLSYPEISFPVLELEQII